MYAYCSALSTCSLEVFARISSLLQEMLVHETTIDYLLEQLRKNRVRTLIALLELL